MTELLVPHRFCGPPSSGNGGWTAGALAELAVPAGPGPVVTVSLRRPPPLDTPMPVSVLDGVTTAHHDDHVVATAAVEPADRELTVVEAVPAELARAAEASYPGHRSHPFPTCFVCGTGRAPGDGMRIFPGPVDDQDGAARSAATWTPDEGVSDGSHVTLPATWAALDCVGGWAGGFEERPMVLARMSAQVDALPRTGEEHVVVGLVLGAEGRKTWTAATVHDPDGRVVARAEHLWIRVDPADFA